jgi:hypothetical protein
MKITIEYLQELAKHKNIEDLTPYKPGDFGVDFTRNLTLKINGAIFNVSWYHNLTTFTAGGIDIKCDEMEISGTYPNDHKLSLRLSNCGTLSALIKIE